MDNIAPDLFGIHHYWCRFEFAKSRGQIHAHMLCINGKESHVPDVNMIFHSHRHDSDIQTKEVANWADTTWGMCATLPSGADPELHEVEQNRKHRNHACASKLKDKTNHNSDIEHLILDCQMHSCSDYCIKSRSGSKDKVSHMNWLSS